jgi:hypothetical protein
MTIFKLKDFARAARKEGVTDADLVDAVVRAARGLIDGEIGRCLIKQRLARQGQGRATGLRAVMAYKAGAITVFVHLFPKSSKGNLTPAETEVFKAAAKQFVRLDDGAIAALVMAKEWIEVTDES